MTQAVQNIENRINSDPDKVRLEVLKANLRGLDRTKKAEFLKGLKEFMKQDLLKDSLKDIKKADAEAVETQKKSDLWQEATRLANTHGNAQTQNIDIENLRQHGGIGGQYDENDLKQIRDAADSIRADRVAKFIDDVSGGVIAPHLARQNVQLAYPGDQLTLKIFNKKVQETETNYYKKQVEDGSQGKRQAINRAHMDGATEVAKELSQLYREDLYKEYSEQIRNGNLDPQIVANNIRGDLGDEELAKRIETDFASYKKAKDNLNGVNILDNVGQQMAALNGMPEFQQLPQSTKDRIQASMSAFQQIQRQMQNVDIAQKNLTNAEIDLAYAKKWDAEWNRFIGTLKSVAKYGSLGALALVGGGGLGYAIGGAQGVAGGLVGAGLGAIGGGMVVGEKYLKTGAKIKDAEYKKIAAEADKQAMIKQAELVAQGEMPTIRKLESAQMFIDTVAETVSERTGMDKAKLKEELEKRAGIGTLRVVAQRVRSAVENMNPDTLSLLPNTANAPA